MVFAAFFCAVRAQKTQHNSIVKRYYMRMRKDARRVRRYYRGHVPDWLLMLLLHERDCSGHNIQLTRLQAYLRARTRADNEC